MQQLSQASPFMLTSSNVNAVSSRHLESQEIQMQENNIYTKTWFKVIGIYLCV